ncbi:spore gernimation protein GerA [Ammoniphilus oxalaticus]|uniref:Spore gernimation protein GerA n=1 Tax=Ammoniphilus oxalaticus TaxID=66863 RepID=A0A419SD29_9BACL|nr:spore germination protein [Ammoniphilus oxalaticus]RKD21029.1 spore gernimation protein GerA [Ammoniphilus oxalaticus]
MFRFIQRRLKTDSSDDVETKKSNEFPIELFTSVQMNVENIKNLLQSPSDLVVREFTLGNTTHPCAVICIDGLVDMNLVNDKIIKNIQIGISTANKPISFFGDEVLTELERGVLSTSELSRTDSLDEAVLGILSGDTCVFVEGIDEVLIIGSKGWESRGVEEPVTEALVRGPRDGFIENLRTNTAHIRRRVRDPNLRIENHKVGRRSKKDLVVIYVDGIVHPELVKEVNRRLKTIDLDDVQETGYIEEWIEDSFLSPFPQLQSTERPDKVAANVLQGRVAILLDGTPFALLAPTTLISLLQSPEDYYERWQIGTLLRLLRFFAAFITLFLPALYIALVSYHPGMIPSKLAFSIASTREGVPFPAVVEALIMEATIELLREAGVRLPKPIGQTIGIVGGLVIGDAAVSAGIVSPVMVIVVAVTAIASFALPHYSVSISLRMLRFVVMIGAAIFGLYGIILVYIGINIHLANLKSFGVPYTTPFAPMFSRDWKDVLVRAPLTMMRTRPAFLKTKDEDRMNRGRRS